MDEIQALLEPFAKLTNLPQSDAQSLSGTVLLILNLECHLQQIPQKYQSTKTAGAMLLNELHKRFQTITKVTVTVSISFLLQLVF